MAISVERKAQLDAIIAQQRARQNPSMVDNTNPTSQGGGLTPERKTELDQIIAQARARQNPQPDEPGGFQKFVQGVAKPFINVGTNIVNTATGAGDLVGAGVQALRGNEEKAEALVNKASNDINKERDFGYLGMGRAVGGAPMTGNVGKDISKGVKDIIGTGLEIGSYAAPLNVGLAAKSGGLLAKVASGAGAGALAGGLASGGSALQEDKGLKETALEALKGTAGGALTGGAFPATAGLLEGGAKLAGKVGAEVLGRTTGAGEASIREAFNNPDVIRYARQASKGGSEDLMNQALQEARQGLSTLKVKRGDAYVKDLEKIKLDKIERDTIISQARDTAKQLIGENGITFKEGKLLNNLDFGQSTIERGQGSVQKAFNDVMKWTDTTPAGLDKLQKKLSQHLDEIPVTERGGAFNVILRLKDSISEPLKKSIPLYGEMTAKYREASELIDEIQHALSLRNPQASDTAIRKLMSTMRQNNELRKELLATLGSATGKNITGKIAGATLSPLLPRGLAGTVGTIGGITALVNPTSLPAMLTYFAATSPRLVAEAMAILAKFRGKGRELPAIVKQQLRNLIIQAINENPGTLNADQEAEA